MISAAGLAGGRGTDRDPKDVARMAEHYVTEKKEDASSHPLLNSAQLAAPSLQA